MNLNHQPRSPNTDAIGDAWGQLDVFFLANQGSLATPEYQGAAIQDLHERAEAWKKWIQDLARESKDAAQSALDAARAQINIYLDIGLTGASILLVKHVETQNAIEGFSPDKAAQIFVKSQGYREGFGGRSTPASGLYPTQPR